MSGSYNQQSNIPKYQNARVNQPLRAKPMVFTGMHYVFFFVAKFSGRVPFEFFRIVSLIIEDDPKVSEIRIKLIRPGTHYRDTGVFGQLNDTSTRVKKHRTGIRDFGIRGTPIGVDFKLNRNYRFRAGGGRKKNELLKERFFFFFFSPVSVLAYELRLSRTNDISKNFLLR